MLFMTKLRGRLFGCLLGFCVCTGVHAAGEQLPAPSDLNVRIVGTASFQGKFTALIEDLNTRTDSFYKVGDPIYGHRILEISAEGLKLEKNGATSYLAFDSTAVAERTELDDKSREIAAVIPPENPLSKASGPNFYTDAPTKTTTRWDLFTPKQEKEQKKPALAGALAGAKAIAGAVAGRFALPITSYKRISSPFGYRKHPIGGGSKMHKGIDLSANRGTRSLAADSGVVKFSGWKGGYGYCVVVDHQNGYETLYGHCSKLIADVGDNVNRGDLIAEVGSTGASTGNHLHFEVHKGGTAIDPLQFLPNL
jgi:murein DD-endopeptidase MepM/ murein hydrolase activator NlpD